MAEKKVKPKKADGKKKDEQAATRVTKQVRRRTLRAQKNV